VSKSDDPWIIEDSAGILALKKIWARVYGGEKYSITTDGPVFAVVSIFRRARLFSFLVWAGTAMTLRYLVLCYQLDGHCCHRYLYGVQQRSPIRLRLESICKRRLEGPQIFICKHGKT
jgi:hypothetical protein